MTTSFKDKIPKIVTYVGIGTATLGAIPIIAGFGTTWIVAGSLADGIQSIIGNVTAGSVFAVCTSLGMTGVFATTTAVGTLLGGGGLFAYLKNLFSPEKDGNLIRTVTNENDNPEIIIKLLEYRFPTQREQIREYFNKLPGNRNFDVEILNFLPDNLISHAVNLLMHTNTIVILTQVVRQLLNNLTFRDYANNDFNAINDANLINAAIQNNDNP